MSSGTTRVGVLLAVLSAGFGCVHVAWALGWRGGVPDTAGPIGQRPVFLAYDVISAALMLAAAGVAVRLVTAGARPRWLLPATLIGSVLALGRGVPALAVDAADLVAGRLASDVGPYADLWFVVVGVLGLVLWRGVRTEHSTASASLGTP